MDPINPVGFAFAAITLPAQIFSGCVLGYSTISDLRAAGKDAVTQVVLFKYQQTRFLVWGQSLDIYGPGIISDRVSDPVRETIVATLVQIRTLLGDAEQIVARYGLERSGDTTPVEPQIWAREVDRQANLVQKVQTSCSLARRMRWAIYDHARFANLVSQLTSLNDVLYQFCPVNQRLSLPTAISAETLARTFTEEGHEGVRLLQSAAVGAERPSLQDVGDRTTAFLASSDREAAESLTFGPARRPQLDKSLFIDVHQLRRLSNLPNDIPKRRTWAQLPSNSRGGGLYLNTLVEWRTFNPLNVTSVSKSELQFRIEALARMLQQEPRPRRFRILDCRGYLEDNERPRYGLVYQFPRGHEQKHACIPQTLYQCLSKGKPYPYLERRFELAAFLAECVYDFLSSGWLHKSINSHNILFFSETDTGIPQERSSSTSLKDPYFTGFALSRPDDQTASEPQGAVEPEVGIYRHPDVQSDAGVSIAPFHVSYDIYSLGTVLLEIGIWMQLRNLYREGMSGFAFRDRLLNTYVPQLGPSMGERYMTAVRKCLTGRFDGVHKFSDQERNERDYILNLQRSLYWEVVKILRDCRV